MAAHDLVHLLRGDEHRANLGALVGAAHPSFDAHVGAAAGARARQHGGEVAGCEADQRIVLVERGDDDLAHFSQRHRIARSRPHDLEDQRFLENHTLGHFAVAPE